MTGSQATDDAVATPRFPTAMDAVLTFGEIHVTMAEMDGEPTCTVLFATIALPSLPLCAPQCAHVSAFGLRHARMLQARAEQGLETRVRAQTCGAGWRILAILG